MAGKTKVSAAARRAQQMMIGGLVFGHVAGLTCFGLALAMDGMDAVLTVVLGFAAVVIFYSIGQYIEIIACELEPVQGMGLVLISYAVRVVGITAGLWFILTRPELEGRISDGWLLLSMTATVFAWVGGVVLVASRQRVPIYDADYIAPESE